MLCWYCLNGKILSCIDDSLQNGLTLNFNICLVLWQIFCTIKIWGERIVPSETLIRLIFYFCLILTQYPTERDGIYGFTTNRPKISDKVWILRFFENTHGLKFHGQECATWCLSYQMSFLSLVARTRSKILRRHKPNLKPPKLFTFPGNSVLSPWYISEIVMTHYSCLNRYTRDPNCSPNANLALSDGTHGPYGTGPFDLNLDSPYFLWVNYIFSNDIKGVKKDFYRKKVVKGISSLCFDHDKFKIWYIPYTV